MSHIDNIREMNKHSDEDIKNNWLRLGYLKALKETKKQFLTIFKEGSEITAMDVMVNIEDAIKEGEK